MLSTIALWTTQPMSKLSYSWHNLLFIHLIFAISMSRKMNENIQNLFETDKKWAINFQPRSTSRIFVHSHLENFGWDFRSQIEWTTAASVELLIAMKETYTTEDARQLSVVQRKCIFSDEIRLEIYDDEKYTFTSCMKECRIQKCLKFCRCVPPFYKPIRKCCKGVWNKCDSIICISSTPPLL